MYDQFIWFTGVVEDRMDPLRLGRCKVRAFGFHSHDISEQPTETLPMPLAPVTSIPNRSWRITHRTSRGNVGDGFLS